MTSLRLSVAGSFTAEPMGPVVEFWLTKLGLAFELEWAPFGQVFQALVDPRGALRSNKGGIAVLLVRRVDLGRDDAEQGKAAHDLRDALEGSVAASGTPHIVLVCPSAKLDDAGAVEADGALASMLGAISGVDVVTPQHIAALYPTDSLFDSFAEHEGGVPFTDEYYTALGTMLARRVRLARTSPKKVVIVDCDDTLWGGVVGEVGTQGVVLDEPRLALQRFLLEQRAQGLLVCVVSKNNEADALAVFDERKDMLLRREHLTSFRINWNPKSENILDLARELELGVDSFVFLDDDAFVTSEARERAPGLVAVQLPEDPKRIPELLRGLWVFDRGRVTAEDRRRADLYKEKSERDRAKKTLSHAEFLATLALEVTVLPMTDEQVPRVAQLTVRTNQFNATARQRSEAEVRGLAAAGLECVVVDVRDRFGEYGLTGAIVFGAAGGQLVVDSFLLSCRVLGRGVEHAIVRSLATMATSRGLGEVVLAFKKTAKNAPYATFFAAVQSVRRDLTKDPAIAVLDAQAAQAFRYVPDGPVEIVNDEGGGQKAKAADAAASTFDHRAVALELSRVLDIRAALPRKSGGGGQADAGKKSEVETALSAIVCEVMLLDSVGVDDDLFELGADSVGALRILAKLNERLGVEVPLYELFQLDPPNIAKLAAVVEAKRSSGAASAEPSPPPVVRTDAVAGELTSFAQEVILGWEGNHERSPTWTMAWRLGLQGKLDQAAMRAAVELTLTRQEGLRQTYRRVGSAWVGRLLAPPEIPLEVVDMTDAAEEQVFAFCDQLANSPMAIEDKPLVRFLLIERSEQSHVLLMLWHQVINDPGASTLLSEEVCENYAAIVDKRHPKLGAMPVRYVDYARWQRDWSNGGGKPIVEAARKRLDGARPFEITDHPRTGPISAKMVQKGFRLDAAATERLQVISKAAGVSLFTVFSAVVSGLLASWSNRTDIVFMAPVNLRTQRSAFDNVLGRFINWTTVRIDASGDPTVAELLARASSAILDAYKYEAVPAPLVYGTNDIFGHPLNRVLLNTPVVGGTLYSRAGSTGGLRVQQEPVDAKSGARNDLAVVLGTGEGRLFGMIRGAKDLFDEATIAKRTEQLRIALERLESTQRLSEVFVAGARARPAIDPATLGRARGLVQAWTQRPGFIGAYLFGSLVRPYADSDSDVDARIVLEDEVLAALSVPERRMFVQKDGKKEADIWLMSRSQLEAMSNEVDLRALSTAVMLYDERGELAKTVDRISAMSEATREDRLRLHYFELTFGIQKSNNALRRQKRGAARMLAAGIVGAAAKIFFVERRVWPASTSWMFEELALEGVPPDTVALMQTVLETGEVRALRELRAKVDQHLASKGFTFMSEPERLLEWYTLTPEGERARQRWAGELARIGT